MRLTGVGVKGRNGSVCAIGVVALWIVCVEFRFSGFESGRRGGDEQIRNGLGF